MNRPLAFATTLLLLGAGCSGSGGGAGKVTLLLKDAPGDFRAATVTISEVALVGDAGTVVLRDTPITTNLLTLAADVATLVDGATVPPGTYTQLRFVITGGYLDVGGTIYSSSPSYEGLPQGAVVGGELQMPSYARSGLKVILPGGGLVVGPDQTWVVDFDVSQSFGHDAGGSGKWVMHPVVKATQVEATGSVNVTLALAAESGLPDGVSLDQFTATLTPAAGGDVTQLPVAPRPDGSFGATFPLLAAGDYDVSLVAPAALADFSTDPGVPVRVTVVAGQVTEQLIDITSANVPTTP